MGNFYHQPNPKALVATLPSCGGIACGICLSGKPPGRYRSRYSVAEGHPVATARGTVSRATRSLPLSVRCSEVGR
jgi:hypothetical protein